MNLFLYLVCLYVNGDMVILANKYCHWVFIYNLEVKTVWRIEIRNFMQWFAEEEKDYVESLVSVR
jgi:hypothetical protein